MCWAFHSTEITESVNRIAGGNYAAPIAMQARPDAFGDIARCLLQLREKLATGKERKTPIGREQAVQAEVVDKLTTAL